MKLMFLLNLFNLFAFWLTGFKDRRDAIDPPFSLPQSETLAWHLVVLNNEMHATAHFLRQY